MVKELTDVTAKEFINNEKILIIDLYATWCGPCKMVAPILDKLSEVYDGRVTMGKLDVDTNNIIPSEYQIRNIPTILFFKDGQMIDRIVGAASEKVISEKLDFLLV